MNPTNEIKICFDGGTYGMTGVCNDGYGSWSVEVDGFKKLVSREKFERVKVGTMVTNNVAEWLALIGALQWLQTVKDRHQYKVKIIGDSQLVLFCLNGRWKTRKPHLKPLRDKARELLTGFHWTVEWQARCHNMNRFGH